MLVLLNILEALYFTKGWYCSKPEVRDKSIYLPKLRDESNLESEAGNQSTFLPENQPSSRK